LTAISVPEQVALSTPAPKVPTASTKQKQNHDDNQNRFHTHFEVLLESFRRLTYEVDGSMHEPLNKPPLCAPLLGMAPDLHVQEVIKLGALLS
jgi:hypothetical protein